MPYNGSKRRWAPRIWQAFGDTLETSPPIYLEPFAGSLAVLLANPHGPARREVVCDRSPGISNFWRSIQRDPDAVAYWADYPTVHHDLTARDAWLARWNAENAARCVEDADWYDPQAAGWWAWAKSNLISGEPGEYEHNKRVPFLTGHNHGGQGVQPQRTDIPCVNDRGGKGVQAQRAAIPFVAGKDMSGKGVTVQRDGIPHVPDTGFHTGKGTQKALHNGSPLPLDGTRLQPWMRALCERLKGVIVLNRGWQSCLTKPMLMSSYMAHHACAILLDPPYKTEGRSRIYASDHDGTSDQCAEESYEWAVEHGKQGRYRIAYCAHENDFPVPPGWTAEVMSFGSGMRSEARRNAIRDQVMFSPGCFAPVEQADIFA